MDVGHNMKHSTRCDCLSHDSIRRVGIQDLVLCYASICLVCIIRTVVRIVGMGL